MSPKVTLDQQWRETLIADGPDDFTVHRRAGQSWDQVAGPFAWILSMVRQQGAQEQGALFNLQITHRATVFDDAMAVLQQEDQVKSVNLRRTYQVKRIEPGLATGGGTIYLSEVKGA